MKKPDSNQLNMEKIREQIDVIDDHIIHLLLKRFHLSRKIGILKNKSGTSIIDRRRERQIFDRLFKRIKGSVLDRKLIQGIWKYIIRKSYQIQGQSPDGKKKHHN
jgi:chorismate mutase